MSTNDTQLSLLREIDGILRGARIRYWLRGGWALDFILGKVTREHGDIDLVAWKRNEARIARLFQDHGFRMTPQSASVDFEKKGVEANVLFLEKGPGVVYTAGFRNEPRWSDDVLHGPVRELAGLHCRTISPQGLLEEKQKTPAWLGRPARERDIEAAQLLEQIIADEAARASKSTIPLGDFGERVAAAHLEVVAFPTVETAGFPDREAAGFNPQSCEES